MSCRALTAGSESREHHWRLAGSARKQGTEITAVAADAAATALRVETCGAGRGPCTTGSTIRQTASKAASHAPLRTQGMRMAASPAKTLATKGLMSSQW